MTHTIAIVGAGPSGCYLAQALLKARPDLRVDLIDALPVPYGLVRYGVAADHQGTKAVARQFARIFERQGARFFGNVHVGRDVTLDDLRSSYDAVVFATGLAGDRRLGIANDDVDGVFGAGAITRALNGHPDAGPLPDLGTHPLIVGNGNVAIDIVRLLAKRADELTGSDLGPEQTRWLAESGIAAISVLGRSPAARAKFDPVMVKELAKLTGVAITVDRAGTADDEAGQKLLDALAAIDGHGTGARTIGFKFSHVPVAVETDAGRVTGLRCRTAQGDATVIACTSIVTAIGFEETGDLPRADILAQADSDAPVYAAGWFRRGPRGTIPDNRADAQVLAADIVADLDGTPAEGVRPGGAIFEGRRDIVDYQGWLRIEQRELAGADPDRCRSKLCDRAVMIEAARHQEETSP